MHLFKFRNAFVLLVLSIYTFSLSQNIVYLLFEYFYIIHNVRINKSKISNIFLKWNNFISKLIYLKK